MMGWAGAVGSLTLLDEEFKQLLAIIKRPQQQQAHCSAFKSTG
jgi:hypothetical protein